MSVDSRAASALAAMSDAEAHAALTRCCGSSRWVTGMLARRPFEDDAALQAAALQVWAPLEREDLLEAFAHHPRIGANLDALREKFASTAALALAEQAGALAASEADLCRLRDGNLAYEARYGYIFIVCATGKSAAQMADLLEARLGTPPDRELRVAADEQAKITRIRLAQLAS